MSIVKLYRLINLLSLDVVAGALCSAIFFAHVFESPVNVPVMTALCLAVWTIYTVDHLYDGAMSLEEPSGRRHLFHRQHSLPLKIASAGGICIAALIVLQLPGAIIVRGFALLVPVVLYLLFHRRIAFLKEVAISLLYTIGVLIPSFSVNKLDLETITLILAFFLIAFLNLLIFSWFDYRNDLRDGHNSAATYLGRARSQVVIWIVSVAVILLLILHGVSAASLILLFMAILHIGMFSYADFFSVKERFRIAGEAIFYMPILLVWIHNVEQP
jgi:4-hydroxybenzoate polyprenyltransferase